MSVSGPGLERRLRCHCYNLAPGQFRFTARAVCHRRAGSAALDLAWVACGRYDGYWEMGLAPWDVAAGTLLVREAEVHSFRSLNASMNLIQALVLALIHDSEAVTAI